MIICPECKQPMKETNITLIGRFNPDVNKTFEFVHDERQKKLGLHCKVASVTMKVCYFV